MKLILKSKPIALAALCAAILPLAAEPQATKPETVKSDAVQPNLVLPNSPQPNLVVPSTVQPDAVPSGSAKMTPPQIGSGRAFRSTQGYSITPTVGWTTTTIGNLVEVVFTAPKENNFAANLNVVIVKTIPGETLEMTAAANSTNLPKFFKGYRKISQKFVAVGGLSALDTVANHNIGSPPRKWWMRQLVVLQNGQAYVFTCTALDVNHKKYEKFFSEMIQSVRWAK